MIPLSYLWLLKKLVRLVLETELISPKKRAFQYFMLDITLYRIDDAREYESKDEIIVASYAFISNTNQMRKVIQPAILQFITSFDKEGRLFKHRT